MSSPKRYKNEKQFEHWFELETGSRIYWLEIPERLGWTARYIKEVDVEESTISFRQEIYDEKGVLREIHEKYPVDKGHQKIF